MTKRLIILAAFLALSACNHLSDDDRCVGWGAIPGTSSYVECMSRLRATRAQMFAIFAAAPNPYASSFSSSYVTVYPGVVRGR